METVNNVEQPKRPSAWQSLVDSVKYTWGRKDLASWYLLSILGVIGIMLVGAATVFGLTFVPAPEMVLVALAGIVIVSAVAGAIAVAVISAVALVYCVTIEERVHFKAGWNFAKTRFWAIAWVGLLVSLVFFGGVMLLFIPALIAMIYTLFYTYAVVIDNYRGIDALVASTQMVSGRFWGTFGRFALVTVAASVIASVAVVPFELLGEVSTAGFTVDVWFALGQVVSVIVQVFTTIVTIRFVGQMYFEQRAMTQVDLSAGKARIIYKIMAGIGLLIIVAITLVSSFVLMQQGGMAFLGM